jgi:hypothetical protein
MLVSMQGARDWIESHQTLTIMIGVVVFAAVATTATSHSTAAPQPQLPERERAEGATSGLSAADAMTQFRDLMDTAEKADLVSSYEFSETERVIYVTDVWYSMTVAFKKDFLAKVAMLQQAISGRHFFEVRNEHSNEKVGEVTAFSGSLEVYK